MKPYYLLLIILLIPQSVNGGLIIEDHNNAVEDTSLGKELFLKYTVTPDGASTGLTEGKWSLSFAPEYDTCPGRSPSQLVFGGGIWIAGEQFEFEVMKKLDINFHLETIMLDAQKTIVDKDKGRYLCFTMDISFWTPTDISLFEHTTLIIRVFEESIDENGFFGDLPINNLYLLSLVLIVFAYRRKVKT